MANSTTSTFSNNIYLPCNAELDGLSFTWASYIVIIALSPVTVVGNSLILAAIWQKTFERKSFHILLSALALTDLFTGLVSQPFIGLPYLLLFINPSVFVGRTALFMKLLAIGISSAIYFRGSTILILTFMSVERWLHMTRRSLVTTQRRWFAVTLLSLLEIPLAALAAVDILKGRATRNEVNITIAASMLLCYMITCFAYFKVFQVIRQHQQQVQGNQYFQHVGQPAINLAKYKRTMVTILYILAVFSISIVPMIVSLIMIVYSGNDVETLVAYNVCLALLVSSSSLNPILYLWRMNDVRNGVKQLFCTSG